MLHRHNFSNKFHLQVLSLCLRWITNCQQIITGLIVEYQFLGSFQYFNYLPNNFAESEASATLCFRKIVRICLILLIAISSIEQKIIYYNMALWM